MHTSHGYLNCTPGFYWPRLLQSQCKQPWLKVDLERYEGDFDSDEDNAKTCCERGKKIQ
jgi:hypothetical protein